jgi:hypothetical protein
VPTRSACKASCVIHMKAFSVPSACTPAKRVLGQLEANIRRVAGGIGSSRSCRWEGGSACSLLQSSLSLRLKLKSVLRVTYGENAWEIQGHGPRSEVVRQYIRLTVK